VHSRVMPSVVLFDFDGTLIDSLRVTLDAFKQAIEEVGYGPTTDEAVLKHFGGGELSIFVKMLGQDKGQEAYAAYRKVVFSQTRMMPLHDGIPEVLAELARLKTRLGIVTGRGADSLDRLLQHHQLHSNFEVIISYDDVGLPKPDPAGILLALRKLQAQPQEAVYIGDSWADVRAARAAGVLPLGARWDRMADFARLSQEEHPQHWLKDPREILQVLAKGAF
jgi:pyrophosphatase PpaX